MELAVQQGPALLLPGRAQLNSKAWPPMKIQVLAALAAALLLLFTLPAPSSAQGKPVVGVVDIQTVAQNISCDSWDSYRGHDCNADLAEGFRIMLETAIVRSNKMDVMERGQLKAILEEQILGESGLTDAGGSVGGIGGVDYLVYGSITKFGASTAQTGSTGGGLLGGAIGSTLGSLGTASLKTEMSVDVKIADVSTGRIILADTVEAEVESAKSHSVAGIYIQDASGDPFSDVQRAVAGGLSEAVVTSRTPFKIVKVQGDGTLILNYGDVFLRPGDRLALFEVGEQFVDPDTGEVLGSEETEVGLIEVTDSTSRFSKAKVVESEAPVVEGSILRRAAADRGSDSSGGSSERNRAGADWDRKLGPPPGIPRFASSGRPAPPGG